MKPRFPRSILKPVQRSCRLYTGCRSSRKQVSLELIRVLLPTTLFDNIFTHFDASATVRSRSSSLNLPDCFFAAFSSSLTTTSFKRSSMRWFEIRSCKPTSGGQTPIFNTVPLVNTPMFVAHDSTGNSYPLIE